MTTQPALDASRIEVRLLGPFEVRINGEVVRPPGRRLRTVLAALALAEGQAASTGALGRRVWGDDLPVRVSGTLATYVLRLRRLLGADVIRTLQDGYRLDPDLAQVDVSVFYRLIDDARRCADPDREKGLLLEALALWRGTPLDGVDSLLQVAERPALAEHRLNALERRIDLDLAGGQAPGLVAELRALTTLHPLREPLWVRLITALRSTGRDAEALEAYEHCRKCFAETLGTDPGPALQQLHRELLTVETKEVESTRSPDPSRRRTGHAPWSDVSSRAPQAAPVHPAQLPTDSARFTGRESDLATLDDILQVNEADPSPPTLVLLLDGPAGVGKTTLAVHWAHRIASRFADGQLFVDLRGYSAGDPLDASTALAGLLRTMGVPADGLPDSLDERSALLRTRLAGRRMVIVLDNACSADQVRPLLPGAGCVVIVTSRSQLRGLAARDGAHRVTVRPLPLDDSERLLHTAIGRERARAEPDAVRTMATLCGHLPLALLIAAERAARYPAVPLADLVRQLQDQRSRLDTFEEPDDATTDIRTMFLWTYRRLGAPAAAMFRRLGLHPTGDLSLPAAAALAGEPLPMVRRSLDQLAGVHLLDRSASGRFCLHDLLHAFATEQALSYDDSAERSAAIRRLLDWYLHTAANAASTLDIPHPRLREVVDQPDPRVLPLEFDNRSDALDWYQAERPWMPAIVQHAASHGLHEHAWKLPWVWATLFLSGGHPEDWLATATVGHGSAQRLGDPRARQFAGNTLAVASIYASKGHDAIQPLQEALEACRHTGDRCFEAVLLDNLGYALLQCGDVDASIQYRQRALAVDRELDSPQIAGTLLALGFSHIIAGDYGQGISYTERALCESKARGATYVHDKALANLAEAHRHHGDHEAAKRYATHALRQFREAGDDYGLADALITSGHIALATGPQRAAWDAWHEAFSILDRIRHQRAAEVERLLADFPRTTPQNLASPAARASYRPTCRARIS